MNKYVKELEFVKRKLEDEYGYKVGYIALQGSQNYGLDINNGDYQSDIDMKALIIPTLDDLLSGGNMVSEDIEIMERLGDDRYLIEKVDVKDIRHYFYVMNKGNPSYLEPLFSDYYLIDDDFKNEFMWIRDNMNALAYSTRDSMIKATYGMSKEKEHGLTHRYPSKEHLIDEYGYDSKQMMHILRLHEFVKRYYGGLSGTVGYDFKYAISIKEGSYLYYELMAIKFYEYDLNKIEGMCEKYINKLKDYRQTILDSLDFDEIDRTIQDEFVNMANTIIKKKIREEEL